MNAREQFHRVRLWYRNHAYTDRPMAALDGDKRRSKRAREEPMVVLPATSSRPVATGSYTVLTESGEYEVAPDKNVRCTCPDEQENQPEHGCKHFRRVVLLRRYGLLPGDGDHVRRYAAALRDLRDRLREKQQDRAIAAVAASNERSDLRERKLLAEIETVSTFLKRL